MKQICMVTIGVLLSLRVQAQFTEIPSGTTVSIGEIFVHSDTLILLGHPNYFAKYCVTTGDLTVLSSPGIFGYANIKFQIVDGNYYVLSKQVGAYDHNYILKSSDYGYTWDTLFHTPGLFYTLSIADSTFGVLGGAFGSHAITDGSDSNWILDTIAGGVFTASATYGDSTAILEGTSKSYFSDDREFTWADDLNGVFGTPKQTQFLNGDTIFSLSNYGSGGGDTYFRRLTYNGSSWSSLGTNINPCTMNLPDYDCNSTVYGMQMNQDGTGYILAYVESTLITSTWQGEIIDKTCIFYTDDFGSSWRSYVTDIPEIMYCMAFLNDTTAFIGGENGLLYKWDLTIPLSNVLTVVENFDILPLVKFFPNPVSSVATLMVDENRLPCILTIFNQVGQVVHTEYISNTTTAISFESLTNGVYYYSVGENRGQFFISR